MSLRRYTWRAMQQRPGRTVLTMLSIVIGVTAAVSVGLGTATTRNAYKSMFALVTGKATLEVDGKGGTAFEDTILAEIEKMPEVEAASPLIERPAAMTVGEDRRLRIQLLGIDPERDKRVRDYTILEGRQLASGDELVLDQGFAKYLSVKLGDTVKITGTNVRAKPFTVVGLFSSQTGAAMAQMSMAFIPLERAQTYFNSRRSGVPKNAIDKIQVVTKQAVKLEEVEGQIAALLPENVQVHRPATSTQLMQKTMLSTEQGLTLTTLFTLLMAFIIILNTFLMNVSERRRQLSIMRAIGAKRSDIALLLIREAIILGIAGTILGTAAGVLLAFVGTTLVAHAFDVQLPRLIDVMTPWPFIMGGLFGLSTAIVGAIIPAIVAWFISPLEGMNRVAPTISWNFRGVLLLIGSVLTAGSLGIIFASIGGYVSIEAASYAGVALLIGLVMLDSVVLTPQASLIGHLLRPFALVEARMAETQVLRNYLRSALTVAVLFIAGSAAVGMAGSIIDCIHDVHDWFSQAITGDYFIRAMLPDMATGTAADLPEELGEELRSLQKDFNARGGSDNRFLLDAASFVEAKIRLNKGGGEPTNVIAIARQYPDDRQPPSFDLIPGGGDREGLREKLLAGEVVIGSVLSQQTGLKRGDTLNLETKEGVKELPIAAVANEYMVGGMAVHMYRGFAEQWLDVKGVDGYIIRAESPQVRDAIRPRLETLCKKYDVILMSQGDIRQKVDQFVSGTEWSLWLLLAMGFVVGAFGVVNTLTMNVLEQTRELGLLRIVAMTKRQVRRTIIMQALIIGGVGLPPGIMLGVAVAYMINLAMMPSFGHAVEFQMHPRMLLGTLVGSMTIMLLAALIPAQRAASVNVVEALHYE